MALLTLLKYLVVGAAFVSGGSLIYLVWRTRSAGTRPLHSEPAGESWRGVVHAFGKDMLPWEKESIRRNPLTFLAGALYHTGILAAFTCVFWRVVLPGADLPLPALRYAALAGALAGMALLVKRAVRPELRALSVPDDYGANLMVDGFLLLVFLESLRPRLEPVLLVWTSLLLLYVPVGKIRHCFYFFYTRILYGSFLGRRGVFPPPSTGV